MNEIVFQSVARGLTVFAKLIARRISVRKPAMAVVMQLLGALDLGAKISLYTL